MTPAPNGTRRLTSRESCPVCGKPDWCLVSQDGARVICARTGSPYPAGDAGWVHFTGPYRRSASRIPTVGMELGSPDFSAYAAAARVSDGPDGSDGVLRLSNDIGVSVQALRRLGVGWNGWAWTFPMSDAAGRTIGIRLRKPDGSKLSVTGSREGLFVPRDNVGSGQLLIAEGPTDTAAALDLGFDAVGRPSCRTGGRLIVHYVRRRPTREIVIMADGDEPGRRGASSLALALVPYTRVRLIEPPNGIKDLRVWLRVGGRHADVQAAIQDKAPLELRIGVAR